MERPAINDIVRSVRERERSACEIAEDAVRVVRERDGDINAYIELFDDCVEDARRVDERVRGGEDPGPLAGVPIAIKDNILIEGKEMTAASNILKGYRATYDAFVIERLKGAGAILIGRVNMDEFAMGSSTETSCYGPTANPHDTARVPGGSSGGSAAAVAMGSVPAALGTDTGGSIRQPAALCGVVGLKPTYGAVSRRGAVAMASSLDQIGPLAATVDDTRALFDVICGHDPMDSTSLTEEEYTAARPATRTTYRIGVPESFIFTEGVDGAIQERLREVMDRLREAGHTVTAVTLPNITTSLPVYYILMPAEASTNLARYDGVRYGKRLQGATLLEEYMKTRGELFGREVRRRIILGTHVLSAGYYDAYYNKANKVRDLITRDFQRAFHDVDVILTPTTPTPAFKMGEKKDNPLEMYAADLFTVPVNLAGVPALSVPAGTVSYEGVLLPVGVQFIAPHCGEERLFAIGSAVERFFRP